MSRTSTNDDVRKVRVKRPDVRREELLAAARELLMARDVADVTVADITRAADAAKGTFYRYFERKEELLIVLRMEFVRDLAQRVDARLERMDQDDLRAQVDALVRESIGFQIANQRLHTVLFHQFRTADVVAGEDPPERAHLVAFLARFIERGNEAGPFAVRAPVESATLLYHALNGAADEAAGRSSRRAQAAMMDAASELVWRALTGPG